MCSVKLMLIVFNNIFCIIGVILILLGVLFLVNDPGDIDVGDQNLLQTMSIVLIVLGSIIFLFACFGCWGAIQESRCLLLTFAVFLIIIFLIELAIVITIVVQSSKINLEDVKKELTKNMKENKDGWDTIQSYYQCCGVDSYEDWEDSNIPKSCCTTSDANAEKNSLCDDANAGSYLYKSGCYDSIMMHFNTGKWILIGFGIVIILMEILGIIMSCYLASAIQRKNDVVRA